MSRFFVAIVSCLFCFACNPLDGFVSNGEITFDEVCNGGDGDLFDETGLTMQRGGTLWVEKRFTAEQIDAIRAAAAEWERVTNYEVHFDVEVRGEGRHTSLRPGKRTAVVARCELDDDNTGGRHALAATAADERVKAIALGADGVEPAELGRRAAHEMGHLLTGEGHQPAGAHSVMVARDLDVAGPTEEDGARVVAGLQ